MMVDEAGGVLKCMEVNGEPVAPVTRLTPNCWDNSAPETPVVSVRKAVRLRASLVIAGRG